MDELAGVHVAPLVIRCMALDCLKEMLRTIPECKGTERIQAKSRIKQLSDELAAPRKGPAQVGSAHSVHREGRRAGQPHRPAELG